MYLLQVYNTAISDPNELNHYEPFTPEVKIQVIKGLETKFKLTLYAKIAMFDVQRECGRKPRLTDSESVYFCLFLH